MHHAFLQSIHLNRELLFQFQYMHCQNSLSDTNMEHACLPFIGSYSWWCRVRVCHSSSQHFSRRVWERHGCAKGIGLVKDGSSSERPKSVKINKRRRELALSWDSWLVRKMQRVEMLWSGHMFDRLCSVCIHIPLYVCAVRISVLTK